MNRRRRYKAKRRRKLEEMRRQMLTLHYPQRRMWLLRLRQMGETL